MKLSITIKGLPKMGTNGGVGGWRSDAAIKRKWKMAVAKELVGLAPLKPFHKVKATFTRCSAVEPDDDNLRIGFKPLRDALVKFGFVIDDKRENMDAHYFWEKVPNNKGCVRIEVEGIEQ